MKRFDKIKNYNGPNRNEKMDKMKIKLEKFTSSKLRFNDVENEKLYNEVSSYI
jgi:hypothetical protein